MKPLAVVPFLLLAACGGSGETARTSPTTSPTSCPTPGSPSYTWPQGFPQDLPKPPGATLDKQETANGVTTARLIVPLSLQQSIQFLLTEMTRAGFTLDEGETEPHEAEAPFHRGALRGEAKLRVIEPCRTGWAVVVTKG